MGAGQRPTEFRRQAQSDKGQNLIKTLKDRAGHIRRFVFKSSREVDYSPLKTDHDVKVTRWRNAADRSAVEAIQELDTRVDEFL